MRPTLLSFGLFALVMTQLGVRHAPIDEDRAIPRYILLKNAWVCVDRNPRQLKRQDCPPQRK
jgi:hypothetical protein